MKNEYFGRPLYPESEYLEGTNIEGGSNKEDKNKIPNHGGFGNLFSNMGQGGQNQLLSMLLGMKNGGENINNIFSTLGNGNPLFEALSSFQSGIKGNKKESQGSPKSIPSDEIIY